MAEIRRERAAEGERRRVDRSLRLRVTSVAAKAHAMVEEFVARSRRMDGRVAELREGVEVWCEKHPRASLSRVADCCTSTLPGMILATVPGDVQQ